MCYIFLLITNLIELFICDNVICNINRLVNLTNLKKLDICNNEITCFN